MSIFLYYFLLSFYVFFVFTYKYFENSWFRNTTEFLHTFSLSMIWYFLTFLLFTNLIFRKTSSSLLKLLISLLLFCFSLNNLTVWCPGWHISLSFPNWLQLVFPIKPGTNTDLAKVLTEDHLIIITPSFTKLYVKIVFNEKREANRARLGSKPSLQLQLGFPKS